MKGNRLAVAPSNSVPGWTSVPMLPLIPLPLLSTRTVEPGGSSMLQKAALLCPERGRKVQVGALLNVVLHG
jgi:hypothetical protein